ncbi:hypothetical protein ABEG17_06410 [Pedococcus sp. KACC 23699]|uniref:Type IV toxin-antitoxin system AbiEi family antitoxin domain-containing protein n=1 Tax=Pedococcus sp. KACC 23699 TaxID=3149228 RepID=A0AAU7JXG0_9MICO
MDVIAFQGLPQPFTPHDAAGVGITRGQLVHALSIAAVDRLARGLYAVNHSWELLSAERRHAGLAHAAYRTVGDAVLSHHSAALLWGLPVSRREQARATLTVLADRRTSVRASWVHLYRATLREGEVTTLSDIELTSPARTVLDCLRSLPPGDGVAIGDAALRLGLVSSGDLATVLRGQGGWPGARRAGLWLPRLDGRRETWLESYSVVALSRFGIEPPEPQVEVFDDRGLIGRVDALWLDDGVVGEADGVGKYLGEFDVSGPSGEAAAQRVVREKAREDRLRDVGLEVVRWMTGEILHSPQVVAGRVKAAQRRGEASRFRGRMRLSPSVPPPCASNTPDARRVAGF